MGRICVKCCHEYEASANENVNDWDKKCPKCGEREMGLRFSLKGDEEKHTCPYRAGAGPWDTSENEDIWERVGDDRVCSFCGSCHPMDFLAITQNCTTDDSHTRLEMNNRKDKIYIDRPGVYNAMYGACKFKMVHVPERMRDLLNELWLVAKQKSEIRHEILLGQIRLNREGGYPPEETDD